MRSHLSQKCIHFTSTNQMNCKNIFTAVSHCKHKPAQPLHLSYGVDFSYNRRRIWNTEMPSLCCGENTVSIHDHVTPDPPSSNTQISLHHNHVLCPAWAKWQNMTSYFKQQERSGPSFCNTILSICAITTPVKTIKFHPGHFMSKSSTQLCKI